jgi:hypothetical protein
MYRLLSISQRTNAAARRQQALSHSRGSPCFINTEHLLQYC